MVKSIKVRFIEKTTKTGNKFFAAKAQKIDGTWESMKFRREVKLPTATGLYTMEIDTANMQKTNSDFGVVWWVQGDPIFTPYETPDCAVDEF